MDSVTAIVPTSKNKSGIFISNTSSVCVSNEKHFKQRTLKSALQRNSSKTRAKKSVTFSDNKHVKEIPHLNDMPDRTIKDCWFTSEDCDQIKTSYEVVVFAINTGLSDYFDEEQETTRGLEYMARNGASKRYHRKRKGHNAVMNEQVRQWMDEDAEEDPYIIQKLYQEASKESIEIALKKAEQDEYSVQEYLANTRMEESIRMMTLNKNDSGMLGIVVQYIMRNFAAENKLVARCA